MQLRAHKPMTEPQRRKWIQHRANGRQRFIRVYGVLLFGGALTVLFIVLAWRAVRPWQSWPSADDVLLLSVLMMVGPLICAIAGYVAGVLLWAQGERAYQRTDPLMRCPLCGHAQKDRAQAPCPECGHNAYAHGRTIRDHRERLRAVAAKYSIGFFSVMPSYIPREVPANVAAHIKQDVNNHSFGRWRWRAVLLVALVVAHTQACLFISSHLSEAIPPHQMASWMGFLFPATAGTTLAIIIGGAFGLERLHLRRRLYQLLLRNAHCPCCLYALHGLTPEADGCTVCPECGGAWKVGSALTDCEK